MSQEQRKQNNDSVEHRYASGKVELRKSESGAAKLFGYALRFDSVYDMWEHTEEVAKGAFANTDMSDIRVLFNHDNNQILGRTKAGTARTGIDANGLWYEVDLPNSPAGENVRVAVERGDIDQSSWGFILRTNGDKWERRDGKLHRVLTDVEEIFDVSPVTFPANPDTTVAKRSLQRSGVYAPPEPDTTTEIDTEIEFAKLERRIFNFKLTL